MKRFLGPFISVMFMGILPLWGAPSLPEPSEVQIEFPINSTKAVPVWMETPTVQVGGDASEIVRLPIISDNRGNALLLTVVFNESSDSQIRVSWLDGSGVRTYLAQDLSEGIDMPNQRSLLIVSPMLGTGGTIEISGGDKLKKVALQWLGPTDGLTGAKGPDTVVAPDDREITTSDQLQGKIAPLDQNKWNNQVVETVVVDAAERIEEPTEYKLSLDTIPLAARLKLQINGLDPAQYLVVWINGQKAGVVTPDAPDLNDPGYSEDNAGYIGWRTGSTVLDRTLFKIGENTLVLEAQPGNSEPKPLAVRKMTIQFRFNPPILQKPVPTLSPQISLDSSTVLP